MQSKPHTFRQFQPSTVVIGVDVGKDQFEARASTHDRRYGRRHRFSCNDEGFSSLLAYAESRRLEFGGRGFVFAMEPTGHYGDPLAQWLRRHGAEVVAVSPLKTSRAKDLFDGTPRKTDEKDARVIAGLCFAGLAVDWRTPRGPYADLRVLVRRREQLVKQRTAELSRVHRVLDVLFPELRELFSSLMCRSCLWLLGVAPTPKTVLALAADDLTAGLRTASRGILSQDRALAIRAAAERSVGVTEGVLAYRLVLEQHLAQLRVVMEQLVVLETRMDQALALVPYRDRLLSIPGIGPVTAATLVGELGDLKEYRHSRQLLKMAGLDLIESSSGNRQGSRRISKRGRRYLRQVLYMAALRGGGPVMRRRRDRLVGRGVRKKKAAVANMCALLRIVHALVRDDVDFDPSRGEVTDRS